MPDAPDVTIERIRRRAQELWERNHRPEGLDIQFWLVAERELKAERARMIASGACGESGRNPEGITVDPGPPGGPSPAT